jgi:hypothetical protein
VAGSVVGGCAAGTAGVLDRCTCAALTDTPSVSAMTCIRQIANRAEDIGWIRANCMPLTDADSRGRAGGFQPIADSARLAPQAGGHPGCRAILPPKMAAGPAGPQEMRSNSRYAVRQSWQLWMATRLHCANRKARRASPFGGRVVA